LRVINPSTLDALIGCRYDEQSIFEAMPRKYLSKATENRNRLLRGTTEATLSLAKKGWTPMPTLGHIASGG
jgi:hypothetical protein